MVPKIGMRIIKTAIAVFISISIYLILLLINSILNLEETDPSAPTSLYTPFFAAIAAAYALHKDKKSSLEQAKIRSVGSVIGGYYGMLIMLISEYILIELTGLKDSNYILFKTITFIIVSLCLIPLIWFTVLVKQKTSVFITCLTYFSVTISIRNNLESVVMFATNRVLSTLIGIGISLLVNNISLIRNKNKDILFVSSIDYNILNKNSNELTPFIKYKLNNLYYQDIPLTFITKRTMSTVELMFNDIEVNFPFVVMNGSAIYDFRTNKYDGMFNINSVYRKEIEEIISKLNINAFRHSIDDNMLHCFYDAINNDGERKYYDMCRSSLFDNFVRAKVPNDCDISLYTIIETKDKVNLLLDELSKMPNYKFIDVVSYKIDELIGNYWIVKINDCKARKENLVNKIKEEGKYKYLITCGSGETDIETIKNSYFSFCLSTAPDIVKSNVDLVINDKSENILKIFDKLYHSYNIDHTIKHLKRKYNKKNLQ